MSASLVSECPMCSSQNITKHRCKHCSFQWLFPESLTAMPSKTKTHLDIPMWACTRCEQVNPYVYKTCKQCQNKESQIASSSVIELSSPYQVFSRPSTTGSINKSQANKSERFGPNKLGPVPFHCTSYGHI